MNYKLTTLLICAGLSLGGCITTPKPIKQDYLRPPRRLMQTTEFDQQTENLEYDLAQTSDQELQADLHLQLARQYINFNNPQRDYAKALKHFKSFTILAPNNAGQQEVQNWLAVLKFNQDITRRKQECKIALAHLQEKDKEAAKQLSELDKLKKKLAQAKQQNKKSKARIQELQKTIEKLKFLDLKLEKKRKSYR